MSGPGSAGRRRARLVLDARRADRMGELSDQRSASRIEPPTVQARVRFIVTPEMLAAMKVGDIDTSPNARAEAHAATIVSLGAARAVSAAEAGARMPLGGGRARRRRDRSSAGRAGDRGLDLQGSSRSRPAPVHLRNASLRRARRGERRHAELAVRDGAGGPLTLTETIARVVVRWLRRRPPPDACRAATWRAPTPRSNGC